MDGLTFIAMQVFCACVLFWYITNLNANSAGEHGFLSIVKDRIEDIARAGKSYFKKERKQSLGEERLETFKARRAGITQTRQERGDVIASDLHGVRKVVLRDQYGDIVKRPADEKNTPSNSKPRKYRKRAAQRQRTHHGDGHDDKAPRFRRKDRGGSPA